MAEGIPNITGSYVGTGAELTIEVGFRPKYIKFANFTTGSAAEYMDSMADDSVVTHDSGTDAFPTSGGITLTDSGFTIGTNAAVNTSANVVHYLAVA